MLGRGRQDGSFNIFFLDLSKIILIWNECQEEGGPSAKMDRSRFRMFFHKHLQITSDIIVDRIYRRGSHSSHCSPGSSMTTMWTGSAWKSGSMALAHSWKGSCRRKFFWICHEFWLLLDPIYSLAHICSLIIFARLYQGEGVRKHLFFYLVTDSVCRCADELSEQEVRRN